MNIDEIIEKNPWKLIPLTKDLGINALVDLQFFHISQKYDFDENQAFIVETSWGYEYLVALDTGEIDIAENWDPEVIWELAGKNMILGFRGNPIGDADFEFTEMNPESWLHDSIGPHSYPRTFCLKFLHLANSAMKRFLAMKSKNIMPRVSYLLGYNCGGAWSHTPDGSEYDSWFDFVGIVHIDTLQVSLLNAEDAKDG